MSITKIEWSQMHARRESLPPASAGILIAYTPIIQPKGCQPGYIAICENKTQYIVHNVEVDEAGRYVNRFWGSYYEMSRPDALKCAMQCFVDKTIRWHLLADIRND